MKLTKEQIQTAANWWAETIANPKYDNGDPSATGGLATCLALMNAKSITKEQQEKFKTALTKLLEKNNCASYGLHCDYHPGKFLSEAMNEAKIPSFNAPWKTNMFFHDGKVTVSYGYGAEPVQIYPKE